MKEVSKYISKGRKYYLFLRLPSVLKLEVNVKNLLCFNQALS